MGWFPVSMLWYGMRQPRYHRRTCRASPCLAGVECGWSAATSTALTVRCVAYRSVACVAAFGVRQPCCRADSAQSTRSSAALAPASPHMAAQTSLGGTRIPVTPAYAPNMAYGSHATTGAPVAPAPASPVWRAAALHAPSSHSFPLALLSFSDKIERTKSIHYAIIANNHTFYLVV